MTTTREPAKAIGTSATIPAQANGVSVPTMAEPTDTILNAQSPARRIGISKWRALVACLCLIGTPSAAAWVGTYFSLEREHPRTEIYRGVYYQTYANAHGLNHVVEIDLSHPGVSLFLTPLDPAAVEAGFQYRLDYVRNSARAAGLAVAINATYYAADSYMLSMVGDFARSSDTIIAEHKINHLNPRNYVVWFDDSLTAHVETTHPMPAKVLREAKWAIGSLSLATRGEAPRHEGRREQQTRLGVDAKGKTLWLGVFESATDREANEALMQAGAEHVLYLDGGASSALYLGGRTYGIAGGLRFGGQRPAATFIGIKADPIVDPL